MAYKGYRDVVIDKEIEAMWHQQARIAVLVLNIPDLEYHQVEGQINAVAEQQQVAGPGRRMVL